MDLSWTEDDEAFRAELQTFLADHLPLEHRVLRLDNDLEQGAEDVRRAWQKILFDHGWLQLAWPVEEGGRGASWMEQAIYQAELAAAGAPPIWGRTGAYLLGPTLQRHASDEQKRRYVEPILRGDVFFCQAFSEPDTGSDLASMSTSATRTDGGWLINGQKCWSSGAMHADRAFLLARTDPAGPRHQSIGFFLVDLRQPGVEVRPTKQASGHSEFAEIFFTDTFVADEDLVGSPTEGWAITMTTFSFERAAIANAMLLERTISAVIERAERFGRANDPIVRQELARLYARVKVFTWMSYRDLTRYESGNVPGQETSLSKMGWSETGKALRTLALDLEGMHGILTRQGDQEEADPWLHLWFWSAAQTIYGGTSEIQRNIVAERLLGLPR